MGVTVEGLLAAAGLDLRRIAVPGPEDPSITWVHSSDLPDPTPFLTAGNLLLTTGTQFSAATSAAEFAAYVDRLRSVELSGLGIGTGLTWPEPPAGLTAACRDRGLAVFEVPYRVPFLAIARWVAETVAAETSARDAWSVRAQRTISLAALSPARLSAVLDELARQLSGRVLLFDAHATLVGRHGSTRDDGLDEAEVQREARRLLRRNARAGSSVGGTGWTVALQTLGRRDHLRGVLATVTGEPPDPAANAVIIGAVALAELALEDTVRFRAQESALNGRLLHLLLEGEVAAVERVLAGSGQRLPAIPVRVLVSRPGAGAADLEHALTVRAHQQHAQVLTAPYDDVQVTVVTDRWWRTAADCHTEQDTAVGVSGRHDYAGLPSALAVARTALGRSGPDRSVVTADDEQVLGLLPRREVTELARSRLRPLLEDPEGDDLLRVTETWLRHNAQFEPAARELGVHRHSLKAQVHRVDRLLDLDLETFAGKAELWALLQSR